MSRSSRSPSSTSWVLSLAVRGCVSVCLLLSFIIYVVAVRSYFYIRDVIPVIVRVPKKVGRFILRFCFFLSVFEWFTSTVWRWGADCASCSRISCRLSVLIICTVTPISCIITTSTCPLQPVAPFCGHNCGTRSLLACSEVGTLPGRVMCMWTATVLTVTGHV